MTHGFQHQDTGLNVCLPKSQPSPQHGRKPDGKDAPQPKAPPRAFEPRPGH